MAELLLLPSNWVLLLTVVLVIVGLVFALFWYFKRAECLTDEDRLHIEHAKVAFLAAAALAALVVVTTKKEKNFVFATGGSANSLL